MYAVLALEPSGRLTYYVGSEADCALWRLLQHCNAWRAHRRRAAGAAWSPPHVSAVRPLQEAERDLSRTLGCPVTLTPGTALPRWRAYGFPPAGTGEAPPEVTPFGAGNPNPTGLDDDFLQATAGVAPGSVAGTLAADWRGHPRGTVAVVTPNARNVTALYVQVSRG